MSNFCVMLVGNFVACSFAATVARRVVDWLILALVCVRCYSVVNAPQDTYHVFHPE